MSLDEEFGLEHLLFQQRTCRSCGIKKSLMDDFYLTRKNRAIFSSAYSYECKQCTIKRITNKRQQEYQRRKKHQLEDPYWHYPDW